MGNSIFNFIGNNSNRVNGIANQINQIKSLLSGNNAEQVANNLMQRNPQFAQFVTENRGKSVDEICNKYGLDSKSIKNILERR